MAVVAKSLDYRAHQEWKMPTTTEAERAEVLSSLGIRVVQREGRLWEQMKCGLFQPVHLLARLSGEKARRPQRLCMGWHCCVSDLNKANGSINVNLLEDLRDYSIRVHRKSLRKQIEKCYQDFQIKALSGRDSAECDEAFSIYQGAMERTGQKNACEQKRFLTWLQAFCKPGAGLVLGVFSIRSGEMVGFLMGYSIENTGYLENVYVRGEFLNSHVNKMLVHEMTRACQRNDQIQEVSMGQHMVERPGVVEFKRRMGYPLKKIPAKFGMCPGLGLLLKRKAPEKYYRFTGDESFLNNCSN